jgi:hypothetical protein
MIALRAFKIAKNVIQNVKSNASVQATDVLAGEVWLTSWFRM